MYVVTYKIIEPSFKIKFEILHNISHDEFAGETVYHPGMAYYPKSSPGVYRYFDDELKDIKFNYDMDVVDKHNKERKEEDPPLFFGVSYYKHVQIHVINNNNFILLHSELYPKEEMTCLKKGITKLVSSITSHQDLKNPTVLDVNLGDTINGDAFRIYPNPNNPGEFLIARFNLPRPYYEDQKIVHLWKIVAY